MYWKYSITEYYKDIYFFNSMYMYINLFWTLFLTDFNYQWECHVRGHKKWMINRSTSIVCMKVNTGSLYVYMSWVTGSTKLLVVSRATSKETWISNHGGDGFEGDIQSRPCLHVSCFVYECGLLQRNTNDGETVLNKVNFQLLLSKLEITQNINTTCSVTWRTVLRFSPQELPMNINKTVWQTSIGRYRTYFPCDNLIKILVQSVKKNV